MTSGVSSGCDLTHRLERDSTRSCQVTTSELRQSLKDSCGLSGCASMFTLLYTLTSTNAMRHIRLAFSLLVLLLASGVSLASQEPATVRGTVMDSVRRAPLVGATVVLLRTGPERSGESVTAKSGKRGEFTISVPAGRYGLTVEHPSLDSMESAVVPVALDLALLARDPQGTRLSRARARLTHRRTTRSGGGRAQRGARWWRDARRPVD